jgi:DNA-binding response OmpR family regulator
MYPREQVDGGAPRILIVDHDDQVAQLVARILERAGCKVDVVHDGYEALEAVQRLRPDLMILEVLLRGLDGIQVCQWVRAQRALASTLVLFLTADDAIEDVARAFHAGADDYMRKPFLQQELLLRVGALLRRKEAAEPASKPVLQMGDLRLDARRAVVTVNGRRVSLSPLPFKLLHCLLCNAGEVVPAEMLLQEVWEYPVGTGDPALVRAHIHQLRKRLVADAGAPTLIRTIPRRGYVVEAGDACEHRA